eukprot:TRINITY_DN22797_c0_g1_i10.p1 TRINITY_DN22797_c0_g1~~TRINITY_DN22797_c0_g1_i10.p1  ORF type:complete len:224 (+),score=16.98 TRINITY_DN22797_c0_g1_i10:152-823(+)
MIFPRDMDSSALLEGCQSVAMTFCLAMSFCSVAAPLFFWPLAAAVTTLSNFLVDVQDAEHGTLLPINPYMWPAAAREDARPEASVYLFWCLRAFAFWLLTYVAFAAIATAGESRREQPGERRRVMLSGLVLFLFCFVMHVVILRAHLVGMLFLTSWGRIALSFCTEVLLWGPIAGRMIQHLLKGVSVNSYSPYLLMFISTVMYQGFWSTHITGIISCPTTFFV